MSFDHRASITHYLEMQADKFEKSGRRGEATALRATASSVRAELDIVPGKRGIASPVEAIILRVCERFGGTNLTEVLGPSGNLSVLRPRFAAIWIAKKRLGWSDRQIGESFHRERTTIANAVERAEEMRRTDEQFKQVTDDLTTEDIRCENCLHSLIPA